MSTEMTCWPCRLHDIQDGIGRRACRIAKGGGDGRAPVWVAHRPHKGQPMHRIVQHAVFLLFAAALPIALAAGQDQARVVAGGGISVPGWTGKIDANEEKAGQVLNNAKLSQNGTDLRVTTGPAVTYWNPANIATGNYTVKATFTEPQYMNVNDHPHPYGIMIAGNNLGTSDQSYLYCAAYGDGTFIVRGFGPAAFQMGGRRPLAHPAVNKAAGKMQPVTQAIALSVRDDRVECAINGAIVASYPKSELVVPGRLTSTDGVYGIRFAHNTDATVAGLTITRP